jgi:hypothetical protein
VPSSLLKRKAGNPIQARIKKSFLPNTNSSENGPVIEKIPPPPNWEAVNPSTQIGLLKSFYTTLQLIPDGLIEVTLTDAGRKQTKIERS